MPATPRHSVIFDTDLGSDVDDAMALAVILGRSDLDLLGITTVYGDTLLRARLARRYAALAGRQVPVYAGAGKPLSGRDVWWAGHEGSLHEDLQDEQVESTGAVDYLVETVAGRPGEIDILAVGPLTNIALALDADPSFEQNVRALWVMGGSFADDRPEHNLASDAAAAERVFASAIPTVISGLEITEQILVRGDHLERIAAAGEIGAALTRDINQWWAYWSETWNVPHDPITVLSLAEPDLFELSEPGRVTIDVSQDKKTEGRSVFSAGGDGATRVVTGLRAEAVTEAMITAISAAGSVTGPVSSPA